MQLKLADITNEEWVRYLRDLIPTLAKYPAHYWVPISKIARNVDRFIAIVDLFAQGGEYLSRNGVQLIELNGANVRLIPEAIINPDAYPWSYVKPIDYFYEHKICGKKQANG